MREPVSRREALGRIAAAGAVLGASALAARLRYDRGGLGLTEAKGDRQVRSFGVSAVDVLGVAQDREDERREPRVGRQALRVAVVDLLQDHRGLVQPEHVIEHDVIGVAASAWAAWIMYQFIEKPSQDMSSAIKFSRRRAKEEPAEQPADQSVQPAVAAAVD